MNPLYQMLNGGAMGQTPVAPSNPMLQRLGVIRQAMANPAAFVKQQFPDIPDDISNDPRQILSYLQQTRGIGNEQIQQLMGQFPMGGV